MSTTVYYTLPMDALAPDITWSVTTGTVVAAPTAAEAVRAQYSPALVWQSEPASERGL